MAHSYSEVREFCVKSLKEVLNNPSAELLDNIHLSQYELDSLDVTELIVKLDCFYDLNIPYSTIKDNPTLETIVKATIEELEARDRDYSSSDCSSKPC